MSVLDALANEGEPLPIGGPLRKVVAKALGGVGDLADMAPVEVHSEDCGLGLTVFGVAAKGDLTVGSSTTAGRAHLTIRGSSTSARALIVHLVSASVSRVFTSTSGQ